MNFCSPSHFLFQSFCFLSRECRVMGYLLISCPLCFPRSPLQSQSVTCKSIFVVPETLVGLRLRSSHPGEYCWSVASCLSPTFSWDLCCLFLSGSCCLLSRQFSLGQVVVGGSPALKILRSHPLLHAATLISGL